VTNPEQKFTQDDLNHIVARETAKLQLADFKSNLALMNQANTQALADINAKISQIFNMISEQNKEQREDQEKLIDVLKKEIEKDFASKIDMINISNRLDQLWIKISVAIMTSITLGGIIGWVITTAISAAGISK
jgi:hypothetical protein